MEIPDLESGYSMANNSINAVMTVIDDCIMKDNYSVPDYIPIPLLKEELINTMLSLRASDHPKNVIDIAKLTQLYQNVCDKETQSAETLAQMNGEEQAKQEQLANNDLSALGGGAVELATPQITNNEGE